jgi:hypothetical protein
MPREQELRTFEAREVSENLVQLLKKVWSPRRIERIATDGFELELEQKLKWGGSPRKTTDSTLGLFRRSAKALPEALYFRVAMQNDLFRHSLVFWPGFRAPIYCAYPLHRVMFYQDLSPFALTRLMWFCPCSSHNLQLSMIYRQLLDPRNGGVVRDCCCAAPYPCGTFLSRTTRSCANPP